MSFPTRGESMSLDESHETSVVASSGDGSVGRPLEVESAPASTPNPETRDTGEPDTDQATDESPDGPRSESPGDGEADEVLGTTTRDRVVLSVLVAICLLLMTWHWGRLSGWGKLPIEIERQTPLFHEHRLDPNTATWVELMQLEGVGEVLGRRIVEDREAHGPFESIDELERVSGIGAKTVEKLRPWLEIRPTTLQP